MRKALKNAGVTVPGFVKIEEAGRQAQMAEAKRSLKLPVIVKPTDRSGSRGIMRLSDWNGLEEALETAQKNSFEHAAIVEEYLPGEEYIEVGRDMEESEKEVRRLSEEALQELKGLTENRNEFLECLVEDLITRKK